MVCAINACLHVWGCVCVLIDKENIASTRNKCYSTQPVHNMGETEQLQPYRSVQSVPLNLNVKTIHA